MKVSIVTPSFNQGRFIERTLQSVASQSGAEIEHVVFDGGSTDNTVDILKRFSPQVRWVSKKDKGQTDAVNKGIRATDGEIIGWLNSDDIYYPGTIARVVAFFEANPEIDLVYGMADHIDVEDQPFEAYPTEPWNFERLKENCFICQPALFFRRRVVEKYGLLDESLHYCMDYAYWLRLGKNGARFAYFEEKLAGSRLYVENKTMSAAAKVHKEIINMHKNFFGRAPDEWLYRYAYVMVGQRSSKEIEDTLVLIKLMVILIYSSLKWNRGISAEMRGTLHKWRSLIRERLEQDFERWYRPLGNEWTNRFNIFIHTLLLPIFLKAAVYISRLLPARFDAQKLRVKVYILKYLKRLYAQPNMFQMRIPSITGKAEQPRSDEIIGRVELPIKTREDEPATPGALEVTGWVVSKSGIAKIEVYCDEKFVGEAHYGALRLDVAGVYPSYCNPGRAGYYWLLDTSKLAKGKHDLALVAYSRNGEVAEQKQIIWLGDANAFYERWIAMNSLNKAKRKALCAEIEADAGALLISIVAVADANIDSEILNRTLDSMQGQLYEKWELVIFSDKKAFTILRELIESIDAGPRVRLSLFTEPTWQEMFAACSGNYIGVVDIGDVLDPRALWAVAKNVLAVPDAGLIYADEDRMESGNHISPRFKPAWSPIYLQNYNYIGRPWFGSASLLRSISITGELCNSATEHALLIRLGAVVDKVVHVPMVLCSRWADTVEVYGGQPGSGRDADHFLGSVTKVQSICDTLPRVSIVIPTCLRNLDIIEKCFSSLLMRTDFPNLEVIVVKNNVSDEDGGKRFLARWPFKVLSWDGSFNWSAINNFGAQHATGELLLFMNDDVEALNHDWLANMVAIADQDSVGTVGAMLMYPNKTIQHGGVYFINYGGGARHLFRFSNGTEPHIAQMVNHNRECSAVTGACMLSRRDAFDAVDGFDEQFPLVNNDTDYCLRLDAKGFSSVVVARATLIHHEGISRAGMPETEDNKRFWTRWRSRLESCDPFSHPNIDDRRDDWWLNPHSIGTLNGRVRNGTGGATTTASVRGAMHQENLQGTSH